MHPPAFSPDHTLSDWPECRLEIRCPGCRHTSFTPVRMLRDEYGDRTFRAILAALRCGKCRAKPAPVYLLAGQHREHCWGSAPGWSVELVARP